MKTFISLILILWEFSAFAGGPVKSQSMWLKLSSRMTYQMGKSEPCATRFWLGHVYFAADLENGKIVRAAFRSWKFPSVVEEIFLTPQEIAGFTIGQEDGHWWFKEIKLDSRLLSWLFDYLNQDWESCHPSRLATVAPALETFVFEWGGIPYGILVSYSDAHSFGGVRQDRQSYRLEKFSLVQMQLTASEAYFIATGRANDDFTPADKSR